MTYHSHLNPDVKADFGTDNQPHFDIHAIQSFEVNLLFKWTFSNLICQCFAEQISLEPI